MNILGEAQRDLSARLATSGTDKFGGVSWQPSPGGAPVLDGSIGWIECSVEEEIPAGDHDVVIARVHDLDTHQEDAPLFFGGLYGRYARL
ncbi:flavin reductase family protein [Mycolicibacterium aubagnense]